MGKRRMRKRLRKAEKAIGQLAQKMLEMPPSVLPVAIDVQELIRLYGLGKNNGANDANDSKKIDMIDNKGIAPKPIVSERRDRTERVSS